VTILLYRVRILLAHVLLSLPRRWRRGRSGSSVSGCEGCVNSN